jgi:2'-5' RNA ligase
MIRAFIAVELPGGVRERLGELQAVLRRARLGVNVSWVRTENIHLTLHFLGDIPESSVPTIGKQLDEVTACRAPFDVAAGGLDAFPGWNRARVIWVGCDDRRGRLGELAGAVREAMERVGFQPERREFAAHLTLGRIKFPRPDATLTKVADSLKDTARGTIRVRDVHLFQSELHPHGSIYTRLSSHCLKGN